MGTANIQFSSDQLKQIDDAYHNKAGLTLQISSSDVVENGGFPVSFTKAQLQSLKPGVNTIKISKTAVQKLGKFIVTTLKSEKSGGALPFLPLLLAAMPYITGAAGVAGATSGIVSAINNKKHQNKMLEETKRHNMALEAKQGGAVRKKKAFGTGLYLRKGLKKD